MLSGVFQLAAQDAQLATGELTAASTVQPVSVCAALQQLVLCRKQCFVCIITRCTH